MPKNCLECRLLLYNMILCLKLKIGHLKNTNMDYICDNLIGTLTRCAIKDVSAKLKWKRMSIDQMSIGQ
jgi:hypothetical protein